MMLIQPLHQAAACVQRNPNRWKLFKQIQKRQVAVLIRRLEDVVEIADRLVVVQDQTELNERR